MNQQNDLTPLEDYLAENPVRPGQLKLDGTTIKMTEGEN